LVSAGSGVLLEKYLWIEAIPLRYEIKNRRALTAATPRAHPQQSLGTGCHFQNTICERLGLSQST